MVKRQPLAGASSNCSYLPKDPCPNPSLLPMVPSLETL